MEEYMGNVQLDPSQKSRSVKFEKYRSLEDMAWCSHSIQYRGETRIEFVMEKKGMFVTEGRCLLENVRITGSVALW